MLKFRQNFLEILMSNYRTQCPSCQATYPLPDAKLGNPKARAKCGRCQQVFYVNENLIREHNDTQVVQPTTPQSPITQTIQPTPSVAPTTNTATKGMDSFEAMLSQMPKKSVDATPNSGFIPAENMPTTSYQGADSSSEFDNFLNQDISIHSTHRTDGDTHHDAWVEDLLKDSTANDAITQAQMSAVPPKQMNDIDLASVIPTAPKATKKRNFNKVFKQEPTAQQLATRRPFGVTLMWLIACALLVALLVAQYALFNLNKLIKDPTYAGHLNTFCEIAKCTLPSADLSSIAVKSEHKSSNDATNVVIYLYNTSATEQLYPHLHVRLKNKDGNMIGDFVATTADYLPEGQVSMSANQYKRLMMTASTKEPVATVDVTPFYH